MHPGKTEVIIAVVGSSMFMLLLVVTGFLLFRIYMKRKNTLQNEQKRMKSIYEETILRSQLEIQEQTLKNISQEIHDNIGQTLSLAKLNLNIITLENGAADDRVADTKELVSKAITDLRSLSKTLNTDSIVSAGVLKAIEYELGMINRVGTFTAGLTVSGTPERLNAQKELILFRIIQESLNNIIKHSGATTITVHAYFEPQLLRLTVTDNGKGFHPNMVPSGVDGGSGLRNMKSRAALIGGGLSIDSSDSGTQITITTPINEL